MAGLALLVIALVVAALVVAMAAGSDLSGIVRGVIDSFYPPAAVTEQGAHIRDLYDIVFFIGVVIFFVVEALILWTVIRYRRRPEDTELPPQTHGNLVAEVVWTVVPTIIVAFLFVVSWQTLNVVEARTAEPDTRVRAVGAQFQWTFQYLDENDEVVYTQLLPVGDDGGLVVPAGRTIQLSLTSPDVIHAFYVPQFLFKRDVVPGPDHVNVFDFKVNAEYAGQTFRGQCAELCGAGHRVMLFDVHAKTPADFDAWLAQKIAEASATPTPPPSGEPSGTVLTLEAKGLVFLETALTAPANEPFKIDFDNQDDAIPHNVEIHDGSGATIFKGEIFNGVASRTYDIPALAAGSYPYICTVHPTMTGTLTVE
jgi:cytochrome c oxidase subunit 2